MWTNPNPKKRKAKSCTYEEPVLLDARVNVGGMQQPLAGRDAAQHLLAPAQLGGDDVGRVRIAEAQVAKLDLMLLQEVEKPAKREI